MTSSPPPHDPHAVLKALLAAIDAKADHFTLLQVARNADPLQIRDAYFKLAKVVHPDHPLFVNNPQLRAQATRAFQAITAANATLSDPAKRSIYIQTMLHAAMERSDAVSAHMQANRATVPTTHSLRPTGPQPNAVDIVPGTLRTSTSQTPRGMPTGQGPTAPGAMNRPMVAGNQGATGQFQRPTGTMPAAPGGVPNPGRVPNPGVPSSTGQYQRASVPQAITGQNQRPTSQMPTASSGQPPMGSTGQFQRPTPTSQSTLTPRTSPSVQTRAAPSMRGLEPPPTVDVARIYLHSGRQQLNRRDWAGAQEALELALPLLEKNEAADCKVMLGWAIFNNNANPEAERIERPKAMWNEVATQFAKTPFHAQAAYYLAIWHKLHGELRHVMGNLQICLNLQPNHIEAAREKRLMEQRRSNLSELGELEDRERGLKSRRASKTAIAASKPTPAVTRKVALPKEQSWLEKLFGGDKK